MGGHPRRPGRFGAEYSAGRPFLSARNCRVEVDVTAFLKNAIKSLCNQRIKAAYASAEKRGEFRYYHARCSALPDTGQGDRAGDRGSRACACWARMPRRSAYWIRCLTESLPAMPAVSSAWRRSSTTPPESESSGGRTTPPPSLRRDSGAAEYFRPRVLKRVPPRIDTQNPFCGA